MKRKDSFVFYESFYSAFNRLNSTDKIELISVISEYGLYGNELPITSERVGDFFVVIRPLLDASHRNYVNGKKGGRPKKESEINGQKRGVKRGVKTPGKTLSKGNDNVNVNDNANIHHKDGSDVSYNRSTLCQSCDYPLAQQDIEKDVCPACGVTSEEMREHFEN